MNCLICDKEVLPLYPLEGRPDPENAMWNGAVVDRIEAGFGSIFDTDIFLIAICDDCVKKKGLKPVN
jgi:hypothetical protein